MTDLISEATTRACRVMGAIDKHIIGDRDEVRTLLIAEFVEHASTAIVAQTAEVAALKAEAGRLREALEGVVDDEPCWYDHHGYCQAHFITAPCEMAIARATLTAAMGADHG